jgi:signal peptidase II
VYVLDRITKVLAERNLQGREPVELVPGVFQLRFTTNPGGAFGLFGGLTWLFVTASIAVVLVIVVVSRKLPSRVTAVALGLILGGALGNLTDRLVRGPGFSGEVVDFLDFLVWPVFNVADSAIVVGALILVVGGIRRDRPPRPAA